LAVPLSLAVVWTHQSPTLVFIVAAAAIIPLAGYMGEATEHLASHSGPAVGGLLNATFGNAAELIIAIVALRAGLIELVKASIMGSILGNLLLILGLSILAGSLKKPIISFNRTAAGASASMLALAVLALAIPALFHALHPAAGIAEELHLSEAVAFILVVTYLSSLVFSLKTHRRMFGGEPHPVSGPTWSRPVALVVLALATVGVAVESEILVGAVEPMTHTLGLSYAFVGLILIPIVGNAAEHAAAVMVARKGKMDLALQIALGSSTQIALLVAPLLILAGIALGKPMDLVFEPVQVILLGLSTAVVAMITLDGETHWFEGVQLLAVYAMIAVAVFFI
jgi:Ca2+:H+ antiporter